MKRGVLTRALAASAVLALLGACNSSTPQQPTPTPGGGSPTATATPLLTPTPAPTATATPAPTARPTPTAAVPTRPPDPVAVAVLNPRSADLETLSLVSTDGRVLGRVDIPQRIASGGTETAVGPDGVFFTQLGRLKELTLAGKVLDLGTLPASWGIGSTFAVSPDGGSIAYGRIVYPAEAQAQAQAPYQYHHRNELWVWHLGQAPRLLASREASATIHPTDAPPYWDYRVLSWRPSGILIVREPWGMGGGDGAFAGEAPRGFTALVDPQTGLSSPLSNSSGCSLSDLAWDGTWTCFQRVDVGAGPTTAFVVHPRSGGSMTTTLSGRDRAGMARFEPTSGRIAYATVPLSMTQVTLWRTHTTLMVAQRPGLVGSRVGGEGLHPLAWRRDGTLLAAQYGAVPSPPPNTSGLDVVTLSLVVVDVSSGAVRTLGPMGGWPMGVVFAR